MQQMLYRQEAEAAQQALYRETVGPYSPAWAGAQIPTGLQQAGYVPGAYVSTAERPFRGVTERWFGGRRGAAQETLAAWAGGGQPLRVPRQIQQMLGMSDAEMMLMGYGRDPLGSWRAAPYQAPTAGGPGDGAGGGYYGGRWGAGRYGAPRGGGYYQTPRGTGVGRISTRGTSRAAGYGMGRVTWRI